MKEENLPKYKDSIIFIGKDRWTVRYYFRVVTPKEGRYLKAARVPARKEIWVSLNDAEGEKLSVEEVANNFKKAILPLIVEDKKKEYGEERVNSALDEIGIYI